MKDIITLADYQVGAGEMGNGDLAELSKALTAGDITGRETTGLTNASGAPLKVESLENTLKVLEFKDSDIVLWKKVPKMPASNTVEEYNQLTSYGTDRGGFNREGELPDEEDSVFVRRAQKVKYLGNTRSVSHPMQLVSTMVGSVIQNQIQHGTLWILRKLNRSLVFANENIIPEEFNGYYAQQIQSFATLSSWYDSTNVIDLKGKNLREANLEEAALNILENQGEGNLLMAPPKVLSNFVKNFHDKKLIMPNSAALTDGIMGQKVNKFASNFGMIDLGFDKFMRAPLGKKLADSATSSKAPTKPAADAAAPKAVVADGLNQFKAAFAGDYYYAVSAVNRYGESALTDLSVGAAGTLISVSSAQSVNLKFTDGGGAVPATGYTIYRSEKNPTGTMADTILYPLFSVSLTELAVGYDGGSAGLVRDKNRFIANTDKAFLIDNSLDVWSFKQLAPLMKMDLAITGPATRFMVLLYGTPILYAPKKMVQIINIGTDLS